MDTEDVGGLDTAAITLHEMYESYVRAGFTKEQALELTQTHLVHILQRMLPPE